MSLLISALAPTQAGLRNRAIIPLLVDRIRDGLSFEGAPLSVSCFEDGRLFVHNGHHRVACALLGGRDHLRDGEYEIQDWTYARYLEVNWAAGYITPFDPRTQTRVADLSRFREAVACARSLAGDAAAEAFIRSHDYLYVVPRRIRDFWELAALSHAGLTSQASDYRLHEEARP